MVHSLFRISLLLVIIQMSTFGCGDSSSSKEDNSSADGDSDGDADTDSDSDGDGDGDVDGDSDSDADTEVEVDASDELFNIEMVRRIDIHIPTDNGNPSSWESINNEAPAPDCVAVHRNYYVGSVTFDGVTYDNIGVRTKGGCGSWRYLDEKPSLKLHFSWDENDTDDICPVDREIMGLKRFTLNNGVQDPSAMHEHLAFQFYRMVGVPAPRTAAMQVYVNDEYYGIYQLVEGIDRGFLKRWFDVKSGKGMMYEGSYWCDFLTGENSAPEDGSCWEREFELDNCSAVPDPVDDLQPFSPDGVTPQDPWSFLVALVDELERIQNAEDYFPAITDTVAWDAFLSFWAASSIIIDWDNYAQWQNNFRIYHDPPTDRWYFIPWGVDQTWQPVPEPNPWGWSGGGQDNFDILGPGGDVAILCMNATGTNSDGKTCAEMYVDELYRQLAIFESEDWLDEIDSWESRLAPLMSRADPHREFSYDEWQNEVQNLRSFVQTRAQEVRDELALAGFSEP